MRSKLEDQLDKEFEQMNVKPWVYHVTEYPRNGRTKHLELFDGITIVSDHRQSAREMVSLIGSLDYECEQGVYWTEPGNPTIVAPATWIQTELANRGFYGVAICDWRDSFSRKRGRVIGKGRLLKHIKKNEKRQPNE